MDQTIPRIPTDIRDIGLLGAIAVPLGIIADNPTGIIELTLGEPLPIDAVAPLLPVFWISPLIATAILIRRLGFVEIHSSYTTQHETAGR